MLVLNFRLDECSLVGLPAARFHVMCPAARFHVTCGNGLGRVFQRSCQTPGSITKAAGVVIVSAGVHYRAFLFAVAVVLSTGLCPEVTCILAHAMGVAVVHVRSWVGGSLSFTSVLGSGETCARGCFDVPSSWLAMLTAVFNRRKPGWQPTMAE